jgi:hypothetical protein
MLRVGGGGGQGRELAIDGPLFVQLQAAHAHPQVLETLVCRLLDIVLGKGPDSGFCTPPIEAEPLETRHPVESVLPFSTVDLDVPQAQVPIDTASLGSGSVGFGFGFHLKLALEHVRSGIESGESTALPRRDAHRLSPCRLALCPGYRRTRWFRLRLRFRRFELDRSRTYVVEEGGIVCDVLEALALEGAHGRFLFRAHRDKRGLCRREGMIAVLGLMCAQFRRRLCRAGAGRKLVSGLGMDVVSRLGQG